jgi:hypothetical protein
VSIFKFKKNNKKDIAKSLNQTISNASVFVDNQGNLINTIFYSNVDEISNNASVSTIISKQSSIINEGDLIAKEAKKGYDEESENKHVNDFIAFLRRPNSDPSPSNLSEINNYMIRRTYQDGIGALIFSFNKSDKLSFSQKRNIRLAQTVELMRNDYGTNFYNVVYDSTGIKKFSYSEQYLNYVYETQYETQILFVFGNYDIKYQCYRSVFNDKIDYILLQNHIIKYATSFHKNACFPSSIIKLSYKGADQEAGMSPKDLKDFEKAVEDFKQQLRNTKGARNAGGTIVPSHPLLEVDIKPLSVPTNAEDNTVYHSLVGDQIFSQVDGGSYDAYIGKSEYSNNANTKLQDMYDGAIRSYKANVLDKLNVFMENLFKIMRVSAPNCYLAVNTSKIKIYQKQMIAQATMITQNNGLYLNEYRKIVKMCSDEYSFLQDVPDGNVFNGNIFKNETKSNPTVESKK